MKQLPQWLRDKSLDEQSMALAEQCARAFDSAGADASKLFNGLRIETIGSSYYVKLADGEPIQNVTVKAVAYLKANFASVKVQYDENITGFIWACNCDSMFGATASLYPVDRE